MAKQLNNTQMVRRLMERSRCGALMQAFVLTALDKYAQDVEKAGPATFDSALLSGAAWVECAKEVREATNGHQLKALGGWKSNAVDVYVHLAAQDTKELAQRMALPSPSQKSEK